MEVKELTKVTLLSVWSQVDSHNWLAFPPTTGLNIFILQALLGGTFSLKLYSHPKFPLPSWKSSGSSTDSKQPHFAP